jgi:hypothetical protein
MSKSMLGVRERGEEVEQEGDIGNILPYTGDS